MSWFFLKQIVQCEVLACAQLWLTFPNAPLPWLREPHPERHFRVAGSRASESEFLLTGPTPTRD